MTKVMLLITYKFPFWILMRMDTLERFWYHFAKGNHFCRHRVASLEYKTFIKCGLRFRGMFIWLGHIPWHTAWNRYRRCQTCETTHEAYHSFFLVGLGVCVCVWGGGGGGLEAHLKKILEVDVIRESTSERASAPVLVRKKEMDQFGGVLITEPWMKWLSRICFLFL